MKCKQTFLGPNQLSLLLVKLCSIQFESIQQMNMNMNDEILVYSEIGNDDGGWADETKG